MARRYSMRQGNLAIKRKAGNCELCGTFAGLTKIRFGNRYRWICGYCKKKKTLTRITIKNLQYLCIDIHQTA